MNPTQHSSADGLLEGRLDRTLPVDRRTPVWRGLSQAVIAADPARIGRTTEFPEEYDVEVEDLCRLHVAGVLDSDTAWAVFVWWFSETSVRPRGDACWVVIADAAGGEG